VKPLINMIGQKFGRLTVVARAENGEAGAAHWDCSCDCGGEKLAVRGRYLRKGIVQSCGCARHDAGVRLGKSSATHGGSYSAEYRIWRGARSRCHDPRCKEFARYGARGIEVYEPWRKDFASFIAHVGPRPSDQHSLDRIDNNGNYEPGNVRWATSDVQQNNRRNNHIVEIDGERMTLAEAIRRRGLRSGTVRMRIAHGWPIERALS